MAEILSPCRCNSRIVITSSSSTTDTPTTDLKGNMVGDRQDGAATAVPSDKKLGKITSTKVGSIYPTLTNVLKGCSVPTTKLWNYVMGDPDPIVTRNPGGRPYRFFDASREVRFLHAMLVEAVRTELPKELSWLGGYDEAFRKLDSEFDLPQSDLSALIRMVKSNGGKLSEKKRKQYFHLPDEVIARIEQVVQESFASDNPLPAGIPDATAPPD
ncbi:hypothetical protein [Burkholderia pyrrocinia]|uniref:hypothetical protein n=1 Tax=Burkholderia pyrrocinia TaxID=60550 RepID=UPI001FB5909B|nr:hypothetical protein [Burkholderia pyrrocinia]